MKILSLTVLFFILSLLVYSQDINVPVDENTGLITYQEVVKEEGSADSLYVRSIEWINLYFPNPQGVTKIRDRENGKIVINHSIRPYDTDKDGLKINSNTIVDYVMRIELRDGRYRYTITDFTMRAMSRFPLERWLDKSYAYYDTKWPEYLKQMDQSMNEMIKSMKEGMKPVVVKEAIW